MKELRQYQSSIIEAIRDAYRQGFRKILVQLPTGGGKSVIFSKVISSADEKRKETLFLVHRRELVKQASQHMTNESVDHGIIMSGELVDLSHHTQMASIQTLWARAVKRAKINLPRSDMLVIDEAHHCTSKTYEHLLNFYNESFVAGVTATPTSKTGKGLGAHFDCLILARDHGASVRELMDAGHLAEAAYMVPSIPDLESIPSRGGDWVEEQLGVVMMDAKLVGGIVDHYKEYALNRKMVAFAVNVAHSRAIVNMFNASGISAAHVDGKTHLEERDQIVSDFSAGKYKILSNCEVFTEGVDMPDVDGVILARPTKSIRLYLQMGGRGLRPKSDGGDCLIMDHTGNVLRHGPLDEEHEWSLDENETLYERDAKKKDPDEKKEAKDFVCGNCGFIFRKQDICPKCGTPLSHHAEDVETARGKLVGLPKVKKPKKKEASVEEKQAWYSMFLLHAAEKGYLEGWAYYKFQDKFKQSPERLHKGLQKPTEEFKKYINYLNIKARYARR